MEAEGIALLQDDTASLPQLRRHGSCWTVSWIMGLTSLVLIDAMLDMVTIRRKGNGGVAESVRDTSKYRGCGINMATGFFRSGISHQHDG